MDWLLNVDNSYVCDGWSTSQDAVVFDMKPDRGDSVNLRHLATVRKVFSMALKLAMALGALLKAKYKWQVVSGPLQSLQA